MEKHYKLKDGKLIEAPRILTVDGKLLYKFNEDKTLMLEYGFKPLHHNYPLYDVETQKIIMTDYTESNNVIEVNYKVQDLFIKSSGKLEEQVNIIASSNANLNSRMGGVLEENTDILIHNFDMDFKLFEIENENLEMLSHNFELDFRLFELECALGEDNPSLAKIFTKRGIDMAITTIYQQAKKLILLGAYEKEDMAYKLTAYLNKKRISQEEYDELIALMETDEMLK